MAEADPHKDILRRRSALDIEMLKRRQALNDEHYYPRMKEIQADCEAIGHRKGTLNLNMMGNRGWYKCGYCDALVETVSFDADPIEESGDQ